VYNFNKKLYINSIKLKIKYFYSFRYIYNNFNLNNIIISKNNTPIIINLGFYKHFSKAFIFKGIYKWINKDFIIFK